MIDTYILYIFDMLKLGQQIYNVNKFKKINILYIYKKYITHLYLYGIM